MVKYIAKIIPTYSRYFRRLVENVINGGVIHRAKWAEELRLALMNVTDMEASDR